MASYQIRQRDPLLDSTTQAVIERRGKELLGVGMIALGVMVALILWSYMPEDPGWMSATDEPAQNLLGRFGASIASPLFIIAGYGSWGLAVALLVWGARFATHKGEGDALGRMIFVPIAVALASVYASTLVPGIEWTHSFGLGGLFGDTVLGAILGVAPVQATFGLKVMSLMVGVGVLGMAVYVLGFDGAELRGIARFLLVGLVVTYTGILTLLGQGARGTAAAARALRDHHHDRRANAAEARVYAAEQARLFPREDGQSPTLQARILRAVAERMPQKVGQPDPMMSAPQRRVPVQHAAPAHAPAGRETRISQALRPEPQLAAPRTDTPAAPKPGLLARVPGMIRRVVDAEPRPELPDTVASSASWAAEAPTDDRIRSRISDAIAARTRPEPPLIAGQRPMSRFEAAIARHTGQQSPVAGPSRRAAAETMGPTGTTPRATRSGQPMQPPLTRGTAPQQADAATLPTLRASRALPPNSQPPGADLDDTLPDTDLDAFALAPIALPGFPPVTADARKVVQPLAKKPQPSKQALAEAQPRLRFEEPHLPAYEHPPLSLLTNPVEVKRHHLPDEALEENARMLESVLDDYGVKGEIVSVRPGPVVTMYELEPAPGLKASRVIGLADDIARSMSALSARVSTVPGRTVIGIELPNVYREKVVLREILSHRDFGDSNLRHNLSVQMCVPSGI